MKRNVRIAALCGLGAAVVVAAIILYVQFSFAGKILDASAVSADTAMVLGASIKSDGTPSDALRDRLDQGIGLYGQKRVKKLLLSGDDGRYHADEIDVMKPYALSHGVPEGDILIDGKGYRTYESCKNAVAAGLKDLVIVTQRFHMGRALYLCNEQGIDAHGVTSDKSQYSDIIIFWLRDLAASAKAWWDVNIWHPRPPA